MKKKIKYNSESLFLMPLLSLLKLSRLGIIYICIPLIIFSFAHSTSLAQKPTLSFHSRLSADTVLIGDHIELSIKASLPANFEVQFPFFADTVITGVEVLGRPQIDTLIKKSGEKELTYRLPITSFDEGNYRIPRLLLPFTDGNTADTAITSPIWFRVNTLSPDTTVANIYDIKMPYREPITFAELAPWIGGGLLIAGIIALLILYLVRRKRNQPMFFPRKPADPPHIIALRELEKIKEKKLWNTDNHKQYYTLLTDIIRFYVEGRFRVPAMEQTTYEIIINLKKQDLMNSELILRLEDTLTLADLVKFARFTPELSENEKCLEFGFRFVNETKAEAEAEAEIEDPEKNIEYSNQNESERNGVYLPKEVTVDSKKTVES